tara:strand:- start:2923 stop:4143 length:1221 start_codon:yes stop_codon:yes gene_type:complete
MADFEGDNTLNTAEKFYQRLNYYINAYPSEGSSLYIKPVRDFQYAENALYGRVNDNHNSIILNTSNNKPIVSANDDKKIPSAVNFVVDAFEALVQDFQGAAVRGKLDATDPYLYEIKAYSAYESPDAMYANYIASLEEIFLKNFLTDSRNKRIRDFSTFLPVFFEFISEVTTNGPCTKTGFITSNFCGSAISGLTVSISDLDPSSDKQKEEFLKSRNFYYYIEFLKKRGFYITKQRPWEMVADIASPFMLQYANNYGITTKEQVLSSYFQRAGGGDIENLKNFAISTYNTLTLTKKFVKIKHKGMHKRISRQPVSRAILEGKYLLYYWVDKYIDIRYAEQREPKSAGEVTSLRKNVKTLLPVKGLTFSLSMINDVFNGFANYEGSFARKTLKRKSVVEARNYKPTY